jgi:Mn2+/Fe2+ NRAMP family transporter
LIETPPAAAADAAEPQDPYQYNDADVSDPPRSLGGILKRIGPGMILASSIVGTGELIATTVLGAKVGFVALWVIVLSCIIKPVIQAEMGRYTIASGQTGLEALNHVPGPRFLRANWVVWGWAVMVLFTLLQIGAMFGGVSEVMHLIVPAVPIRAWIFVWLAVTLALLLYGGYERVEKLSVIKVGLFTLMTLFAAVMMVRMPQFFTWDNIREGLAFKFPTGGLAEAVAVFGITGVGASELFMYPYWCVEKGYARFAGRRDESPAWLDRARGWVRVMHVDILASMVIYTVATLAFYFLGAGVLHAGEKQKFSSGELITTLSNMYTQTLGGWSLYVFYVGAIATLYGTIFAATAANSRVFSDMFRIMGVFERDDYAKRVAWRRNFVLFLTVVPVCLFLIMGNPVQMVVVGGVAQALMLPAVAVGTLYLRHRRLPRAIVPPQWVTAALWVSATVICVIMTYYAWLKLTGN